MCSIFQQVLEVLTAHQGHQELWNRSPFQPLHPILNNCTCLPFGAGFGAGVTTLIMAENHIKTNSGGLQYQA